MAEYEEMVASAADYDSDDSGADTDEEVNIRVSHQNMFFRKKINPTHSRGIWVLG